MTMIFEVRSIYRLRKLLRVIEKIEKHLENGENDKALALVRELKEDTQKDIEA